MQKIVIVISVILFSSCSFLPESSGKDNELIVIVSPEDKPFIKNIMADLFFHKVHTPQPEFEFNIHYKDPWEIEEIKEYGCN